MLATNLLYSQALRFFPSKAGIIFAVLVFELGSLICGVAPSMSVLIFGRAVAGLGAAGIFTCGVVILTETSTMAERGKSASIQCPKVALTLDCFRTFAP
jgi:MFS family permease